MSDATKPIGLIGFGEAGQAFASGWFQALPELDIHAFDMKTDGADAGAKWADYKRAAIRGCDRVADLTGLDVFSLVTADQAQIAAASVANSLVEGSFFFDGNSCAPQTKIGSAHIIEAKGGRYVDVAIMAPVHPKLHKAPLLISGPHADAALIRLGDLGMNATIVPGDVGAASSVKMVRSIMMKGLEAVMMECVLAGRAAGLDERVLDSLDVTYPQFNWRKQAARMMERATTHGVRRAAEMREVAKTVDMLGLPPSMSSATVDWMDRAARSGLAFDGSSTDYAEMSDFLLAELIPAEPNDKPKEMSSG